MAGRPPEPGRDRWRGVSNEEVDDVSADVSSLWRRRSRSLAATLLGPYRRALILAGVLILVRSGATLAIPYLVGIAIDQGIRRGSPARLEFFAALLLVAICAASLAQYAFMRVSGGIGQDLLLDLRLLVFRHVQELSISFYERYTSGRIIARLTSDVDSLTELLNTGLTSLLTSLISVVAIAVILLRLDFRLGLVTLLAFPLVVALTQWFRSNSERAYRAVRRAIALVIVHYTESLAGIRAVHAYGREPRNREIFEDVNDRYRAANVWTTNLASIFGPAINLLGRVTTAAVLVYGGYLVVKGQLTLGVLTAFVLYVRQFFEPMQELSQFYNLFQAAAAALEKLAGVMEEQASVPEPEVPARFDSIQGAIEFDGVTFAYREAPVLESMSVAIPAGQVVALVGPTGAGKSTMARLISRFYDPTAGSVRLDGVDLRSVGGRDLRRAVIAVTQESYLFSGTIGSNIAFGRPSASLAEIEAAATAVGAHEFITQLPAAYDTDVRRRGVRLSAGQRQLVAFARAFLADPRVLILDEATSSLDLPTERLVQHALRTLLRGRTAIIIAHRLSTVEIADRVLVIDRGKIVEDGSPQDLATGGGRYGDLHRAWLESLV